MTRAFSPRLALAPLVAALLAAGCATDHSELDAYIARVKAQKSTAVDPIPQIQVYEPFRYSQSDARNPFEPFRDVGSAQAATGAGDGLQPDFARNREPLEGFPLEALRMHGTLTFRNQSYALVQAPDGIVHRVQTGNHMGQNFGRIVAITPANIALEEIVPDGLGGYVKREATVALSGGDA